MSKRELSPDVEVMPEPKEPLVLSLLKGAQEQSPSRALIKHAEVGIVDGELAYCR